MTSPPNHMSRITQKEARRYKEALEALEQLLSEEIKARFSSSHMSEEKVAGKSRIYSLLNLPRNICRRALGAEGEKDG